MNKKLLKAKIKEATGSKAMIEELHKLLGISERSICSKTNGTREFRPSEIDLIRIRYQLTAEDTVEIFIKGEGERK